MKVDVEIKKGMEKYVFSLEAGESVADVIKESGLMKFPCSRGKCGKCRIYANTIPCEEELELLGACNIESGMRLACYTYAQKGLKITVPEEVYLKVLTSIVQKPYPFLPIVTEKKIAVEPPSVEDQRSDVRRLLDAAGVKKHCLSLDRLCTLPYFIRNSSEYYALIKSKELYNFSSSSINYALTVDIGTTTISAHLTDLGTGEILAEHGEPNKQAAYGADVISRIQFDMDFRSKNYSGNSPLRHLIIEQLNSILKLFLQKFELEDVAVISIAGNTTMLHLLCGLPTEHIGKVPFTPVILLDPEFKAKELGICSEAPVFLMPSISSYVGADIVAAMLTAEVWRYTDEPFLLIDIGTNAETVLGCEGNYYACSAAAGPCFEGATIECGVSAQNGAIDSVSYSEKTGFRYTTIGTAPPIGICGSGIFNVLELMLDHNLMDESGYIQKDDSELGRHIEDDAFFITDSVFFSQKDIREVQMAKAAVRAGIDSLLLYAGLKEQDIKKLFIAGGFGSAISPRSAARIGLFPPHLVDSVTVLKNAASMGALRYVTEKGAKKKVEEIRAKTKYIELSCDAGFTGFYIERMQF